MIDIMLTYERIEELASEHEASYEERCIDLHGFARAIERECAMPPTEATSAASAGKIDWEFLYNEMAKKYADASCEIARLDLAARAPSTEYTEPTAVKDKP